MKTLPKTVEVLEVANEGLVSLLNQNVEIRCNVYIYCGQLVGVNDTCVKLDNAHIVYETGPFTDKKWKDAQPLPNTLYVMLSAVEAFGVVK